MKNIITAKRLQSALSNMNPPITARELANKSGVSEASISQYLSGSHKPSNISSGKIADVLLVNPLWLMGFDVSPIYDNKDKVPSGKGIRIPVLGRVAAGIPIEAVEDILDFEEIDEKLASSGEFFGLKIKGDSMTPRICDGDVVIVRRQSDAESGNLVIATVNGNDAVCKRLVKYSNSIALVSNNPDYAPLVYSDEEIITRPVSIIGKVVELRGKL